ncbi:MAG: hypothetical protein OXI24_05735 [Candidatus Poribacteria bacterium]|nr:hypothetical protein [Candidatus Poribacteria bacterium]
MHRISKRTVFYISYIFLTLLFVWSSWVGCEKSVWKESLDSPDQLGLAVVEALNRKDIEQLNRLRVQRQEYLAWVWPAFPASRPPSNFPGDFAWSNLNTKCNIGMKKWVARYGGQNLQFVSIRFDQPRENYDGFYLLRGTVLTLQNAAKEKQELEILGSVVVKNGRYKLLSYED